MEDKVTEVDIEKCKSDIVYFAEKVLKLDLCKYEKLLLQKIAEAKKDNEPLYVMYPPKVNIFPSLEIIADKFTEYQK